MDVRNSKGSSSKLSPGEGITESKASAWGKDTDNKCALSGKDEVANSLLNWLSSSLQERSL